MKAIGTVLIVIGAGLAIVALSVFAAHDTSILVAPPEAVAETFVRDLATARYELAWRYLARDVKEHTSADRLRSTFEPLRESTGKPDQVVTSASSVEGERARVLATLEGRQATAAMYVDLIRQEGVWKIAAWPLDLVQRP